MNKREQYEKENGLDVYASMENYGSFKDEYVKWLELELDNQAKDNDVLGDVSHCDDDTKDLIEHTKRVIDLIRDKSGIAVKVLGNRINKKLEQLK